MTQKILLRVNFVDFFNFSSSIGLNEFGGSKATSTEIFLSHEPFEEVTSGKSFQISARVVGLDSTDKISVQISKMGGGFNQSSMIPMSRISSSEYTGEIPANLATPGLLNYRIIIQKENTYAVFPGNHIGNPFAWNNFSNETYQTFVAAENGKLVIYDPTKNRDIRIYPQFRRGFQTSYITGPESQKLILKLAAQELGDDHTIGFQYFIGDKIKGRTPESFDNLVIRARTSNKESLKLKITLINKDAFAFSSIVTLSNTFQDLEIPLQNLVTDSILLLRRPYPGFLPLWFKASGSASFNISEIEKIQVTIGTDLPPSEYKKPYDLEISEIWLRNSKAF